MKGGQVFAVGEHGELEDNGLVSKIINQCPDPADLFGNP